MCHNILSSTARLYSLVHLIFSMSAHHLYMYKRHYLCILSIKEEKKRIVKKSHRTHQGSILIGEWSGKATRWSGPSFLAITDRKGVSFRWVISCYFRCRPHKRTDYTRIKNLTLCKLCWLALAARRVEKKNTQLGRPFTGASTKRILFKFFWAQTIAMLSLLHATAQQRKVDRYDFRI